VAQSLIYAALIAAAGISGVGAGGAAALGLLKMTDTVLQGEKFSSAAYSGAKTGATAYGAGQVGKALQGGGPEQLGGPGMGNSGETPVANARSELVSQRIASANSQRDLIASFAEKMGMSGTNSTAQLVGGVPVSVNGVPVPTSLFTPEQLANINAAKAVTNAMNEAQIKRMFHTAARIQQLNEGVWDRVKGAASKAAGAVANKAQTVGTNLTTKVTADKLMTAWKKAGSPTDSEEVKAIMQQAGVDDAIIASSMKSLDSQQAKTGGAGAFDQMANQLAPATAQPIDAQTQKFIQQLVASYTALTPAEKAQLKKELQDAVTASDVGGNVVKATNESKKFKKKVQ
jgi:hypothetical protein